MGRVLPAIVLTTLSFATVSYATYMVAFQVGFKEGVGYATCLCVKKESEFKQCDAIAKGNWAEILRSEQSSLRRK